MLPDSKLSRMETLWFPIALVLILLKIITEFGEKLLEIASASRRGDQLLLQKVLWGVRASERRSPPPPSAPTPCCTPRIAVAALTVCGGQGLLCPLGLGRCSQLWARRLGSCPGPTPCDGDEAGRAEISLHWRCGRRWVRG